MIITVSGQVPYIEQLARTDRAAFLGVMVQPNQGNDLGRLVKMGLDLVGDNAAFSGPNPLKFWNLLVDLWTMGGAVRWVAIPDKVCDHAETLAMFHAFLAEVEYEIGYVPPIPLAFVAQNGAEADLASIPWDQIACVFLGGDDAWKLGEGGRIVAAEAKRRGKWVHVGRVNSAKRARYCRDVLAADSVDGSGFSKFGQVRTQQRRTAGPTQLEAALDAVGEHHAADLAVDRRADQLADLVGMGVAA